MGMTGLDRRIRYLYMHTEGVSPRKSRGNRLRANVISRVKATLANAFAMPTLASVVA